MTDEATMLRAALVRLSTAVHALAKVKDGKTLFEHSPTKDQECYEAWKELNEAQHCVKIALDPDVETDAGWLHWEAPIAGT